MNTIEVYRTDVDEQDSAKAIEAEIRRTHPTSDPSFDLEDCDNVLRIKDDTGVDKGTIEAIVQTHGFQLNPLP